MMEAFATRLSAWFDARVVRLQTFIRSHLGPSGDLKVLSLLVATVIYYFIQNIISFSGTYAVPLDVTVREANVAVLSVSADEIKVTLKGPEADIRAFDPAALKIRLALSHAEGGSDRQWVDLRADHVEGAGKLRVVRIDPEAVEVEFDSEVERRLPLATPPLTGSPLQGEASVELTRKHVDVRGPKSKLEKLLENRILIPTEPIDVTGKTQGFTKSVKVRPPVDSGISSVRPEEVEAKVEILNIPGPEQSFIDVPRGSATNVPAAESSATTNPAAAGAADSPPSTGP